MENKYNRQIRLFGVDGQEKLQNTAVLVVGAGGIGSHVIQQLAHIGVGSVSVIDDENLETSNLNRYVTATHGHEDVGKQKVELAERLIDSINKHVSTTNLNQTVISPEAINHIKDADYVFGCVDQEGVRLFLTEVCSVYETKYLDMATDIVQMDNENLNYGGRICLASENTGCLVCYDELDHNEATRNLEGEQERGNRRDIYGVDDEYVEESGPSVITINGVVSSIGMTEFLVDVTGIRDPNGLLVYRGTFGTISCADPQLPKDDCYYCNEVRGKGEEYNPEKFFSE